MTRSPDSLHHLVDDMLSDAGQAGDSGLRSVLLSLGSLGSLPVPAPSGQLARLMAGAATEAVEPAAAGLDVLKDDQDAAGDELARRRLRRHRPTVLGLALLAGMGTGIGGVAASSPAPGGGSHSVQQLLENWSPSWTIQGQAAAGLVQPDHPAGMDRPGAGQPAAEPVSAGRGPADSRLLQQDHVPRPPQAAEPHLSAVAPGEAGKAPRALAGGQEPGRRNRAAGTATPGEGGQREPGGGNPASGREGEPADEAVLPPVSVVVEPLKDVVLQAEDARGEVAKPLPGNRWLQKFNR